MPFGVVSGVGRRMGVLDCGGDRRREGAVLGVKVGHPIVTNRDIVRPRYSLPRGVAMRLFPNIFGGISCFRCVRLSFGLGLQTTDNHMVSVAIDTAKKERS